VPLVRETLFDASEPVLGIWASGPKDRTPRGYLRRARGIHAIPTRALRSRAGSTAGPDIDAAHSLVRFNDLRFQAAGTVLYRNAVSVLTGLDGDRLSFVRMPPSAGLADSLFVCNGGILRKIDTAGAVTVWGIDAPSTGLTAVSAGASVRNIDTMEVAATWTGVSATLADEATIFQEGANSMRMTVAASTTGTATKSITVDLSTVSGGGDSPDEDWIETWFRVDEPDNIDRIEIAFSLGNTTFATNMYARVIRVASELQPFEHWGERQRLGTADFGDAFDNQDRIVAQSFLATPSQHIDLQNSIGQTFIPATRNTWTRLRLTKSSFVRAGSASGWSGVQAVRLTVVTNANGQAVTFWDDLRLHGRGGRQGTYSYAYTYRNTTTGNRSNASPETSYVDAARERINLSAITVSADTQVNQREIWRTMGNGDSLFRAGVINDNVTTTFTDAVADFLGIDSLATTAPPATTGVRSTLENLLLPTDNDRPFDTFSDAMGDTENVMWWLDSTSGRRGRAYFSPAGRPESRRGFIEITDDDDPLQKLFLYNGIRYVFSESRLFRIDGSDPYTAHEVFGVPGILPAQRFTVAVSPLGAIWQAKDGLRIFDGIRSRLLAHDQLGVLFRGENAENLTAFEGVVADYGRDEYLISDTVQTLAFNLRTGLIRDLGRGYTALYYEHDADEWIGARPTQTEIIEDEGTFTDAGSPIDFAIETPALRLSADEGSFVRRLIIEADTSSGTATVTPTLILGETEVARPPLTVTATRQRFELPIDQVADFIGLRLEASLTVQLSVYRIDADVYRPETPEESPYERRRSTAGPRTTPQPSGLR